MDSSDQLRLNALLGRLRVGLTERTLIKNAARSLIRRYHVTPDQAVAFLVERAREDARDIAAVATEILERQSA